MTVCHTTVGVGLGVVAAGRGHWGCQLAGVLGTEQRRKDEKGSAPKVS